MKKAANGGAASVVPAGALEDLIRVYDRKATRKDAAFTRYARDVARETAQALRELKGLRRGIRVEGIVR